MIRPPARGLPSCPGGPASIACSFRDPAVVGHPVNAIGPARIPASSAALIRPFMRVVVGRQTIIPVRPLQLAG